MNLEMYGAWVVEESGEKNWYTFPKIEDAVYAFPEEIIYKLTASPVGKFKLKMKVEELRD